MPKLASFSLRLSEEELRLLDDIRKFHGLTSAAEAFRFVVRKEHRTMRVAPKRGDS